MLCWLPLPALFSFQAALYKTSFLLLSDTVMNANRSFILSLSDFLTGHSSFIYKEKAGRWFIWGFDMCEHDWMWLSGCVEKVGTGACVFSASWMKQEWKKLNEQKLGQRNGMDGLKKCVLITLWTLSHVPTFYPFSMAFSLTYSLKISFHFNKVSSKVII